MWLLILLVVMIVLGLASNVMRMRDAERHAAAAVAVVVVAVMASAMRVQPLVAGSVVMKLVAVSVVVMRLTKQSSLSPGVVHWAAFAAEMLWVCFVSWWHACRA